MLARDQPRLMSNVILGMVYTGRNLYNIHGKKKGPVDVLNSTPRTYIHSRVNNGSLRYHAHILNVLSKSHDRQMTVFGVTHPYF